MSDFALGLLMGGSMTDPAAYRRPRIPEMLADIPYDPFKLDVWQLASDFNSAFDVSRSMMSSSVHFQETTLYSSLSRMSKLS